MEYRGCHIEVSRNNCSWAVAVDGVDGLEVFDDDGYECEQDAVEHAQLLVDLFIYEGYLAGDDASNPNRYAII